MRLPDEPPSTPHVAGTIWTCDECGREWVLVVGSPYNEPYSARRPLTEATETGGTGERAAAGADPRGTVTYVVTVDPDGWMCLERSPLQAR